MAQGDYQEGNARGGEPGRTPLPVALTSLARALILLSLATVFVCFPLLSGQLLPAHHSDQDASHQAEALATRLSSHGLESLARQTSQPSSTPLQPAQSSTAKPSASPRSTPSTTVDELGLTRSNASGDGTWTIAPAVSVTSTHAGVVHYILYIEGGTGVDAKEAATTVASVLNDERGWPAIKDVNFVPVTDSTEADFNLNIATPPTVNQLCQPLDTESRWSCRNGNNVSLNSDRWTYQVPWITDVTTYRSYLINHEVGHWLGYEHQQCQGAGLYAPLMMQQSVGLGQCTANPWPTRDNQPASSN